MYKYILSYMITKDSVFGTSVIQGEKAVNFEDVEVFRETIAKDYKNKYDKEDVVILNMLEFKDGVLQK